MDGEQRNQTEGINRMKLWTGSRMTRLLAVALLVLLAMSLAAPSVARAGCGDYLVPHPSKSHEAMPSTSTPEAPGKIPPCSGPHCSRHSELPPLPVPSAPVSGQLWAMLPVFLAGIDPKPTLLALDERSEQPSRLGQPTYHPPRELLP